MKILRVLFFGNKMMGPRISGSLPLELARPVPLFAWLTQWRLSAALRLVAKQKMMALHRQQSHVFAPMANHVLVFVLLLLITTTTACVTKVAAFSNALPNAPAVPSYAHVSNGIRLKKLGASFKLHSTSPETTERDSQPNALPSTVPSEAPQLSLPVGSRTIHLPNRQGTRMRVFYPADETNGRPVADKEVYAPYGTDGRRPSLLAPKTSGCLLDAPLADVSMAATQHWPMLLYSHGIGHNMDTCVLLFQLLASKGIVVGALEHTDGTASPYTMKSDGSELKYSEYVMTDRQKLARRGSELLEAAEYLPKEILSWASRSDKEEADGSNGRNIVENYPIVIGGNDFGGAAAVMAANGASANCNVEGLLLHDPALGLGYGMLPPNGAGQSGLPTVTYVSDQARKSGTLYGTRTLHVKGAKKGRTGSFTDAPLWGAIIRKASTIHEELVDSMATFLWTRNASPEAISEGSLIEVIR